MVAYISNEVSYISSRVRLYPAEAVAADRSSADGGCRGGPKIPSTVSQTEQDITQLLYINVQWFRGGLVFKAHRLVDV